MKFFLVLLLTGLFYGDANVPVAKFDLHKYAGTWYSLYSMPTMLTGEAGKQPQNIR